jgi:hypothetical protein
MPGFTPPRHLVHRCCTIVHFKFSLPVQVRLNADKLYASVSPFAQNTSTYGLHYSPPANIRKSINGGSSFTTAAASLPDRIFTDITISPTNDDSVFVTLGGFGTTHIYVTGDGGSNWTPRGSGLPDVPFNCILIDSANANILYAGCDLGVYISPDRGANWYDYNNGFWDATYVMDLVFAPGNKLRAVTHGKGIFETDRWDGNLVLPVTVLSFSGSNAGNTNKLSWAVSQEYNLLHYEVQRSSDGYNYTTAGLAAAINSLHTHSYTFYDKPAAGLPPVSFFRLKIVNTDGTWLYSDVVILRQAGQYSFTVAGNPFSGSLNIRYSIPAAGPLFFRLYDQQGRLLRNEYYSATALTGVYSITGLQYLTAGMYVLRIEGEKYSRSLQVLKE